MTSKFLFFSLLFLLAFAACQPAATPGAALPPFVQPPIPGAEPAFQSWRFDAAEGFDGSTASGTRIVIPAGALLRADGSPATGEVLLRFREFHDAADIFLAGIPMAYGGGHFSTAGSFELRAEQAGEALGLRPDAPARVRMASFEAGTDYQFYYLDEAARGWDSLGTAAPEVNTERRRLRQKLAGMDPGLAFPLNRQYVALNHASLLDMYYNNNLSQVDQGAFAAKMSAYGIGWLDNWTYESIEQDGVANLAAMAVWKLRKNTPFPDWTKGLHIGLSHKGGRLYEALLANADSSQVFRAELEYVMPIKALFAFSPEHWRDHYEQAMAAVRAEQERLALMAEVYRSFEVGKFGIYNWDKLLKEEGRVEVLADFDFPVRVDAKLATLEVVYITGDNKGIVKYPQPDWDKMAVLPDPKGRLFCILPDGRLALYTAERYARIDLEALRRSPQITFDMAVSDKPVRSAEAFKRAIGGI